jgi:hypothetical protein
MSDIMSDVIEEFSFGEEEGSAKLAVVYKNPVERGISIAIGTVKPEFAGKINKDTITSDMIVNASMLDDALTLHFYTEDSLKSFTKLLLKAITMLHE